MEQYLNELHYKNKTQCEAALKVKETPAPFLLDLKSTKSGLPCGTVLKNPPANAGDTGLSPGPGRSHMPRSN